MVSCNTVIEGVFSKSKPPIGEAPAIAMINPRYRHNVGAAVRAASCFDLKQVWWTGNRVELETKTKKGKKARLGREERMKGYKDVTLCNCDYIFDQFSSVVPIAIELSPSAQNLMQFEHPENALYVFGPEDGGLGKQHRMHCQHHVVIPTKHCTNLGAAIYIVLYDRMLKQCQRNHEFLPITEILAEDRGWAENIEMDI
jgi:tRNA(Leu) C34 or U34 (ribose-2'-O)-methylase TrmL